MGENAAGDAQTRVQEAIDRLVADGGEVGLQVAVIHRGALVVDAVSGLADAEQGLAITPDTLFFAASTAKGVASAVAHVLVERGELTYDLRVADVWPEFAAHGKGGVTLRHVLMHTAGVPAPPYTTTVEDLCDWDRMCRALADAEPWWEPGHPVRVPRPDLRLPARRDRAPGDRAAAVLVASRSRHRAARGRGATCTSASPRRCWAEWRGRSRLPVPPSAPDPFAPEPGSPADKAVPPGIRPGAVLANRRDVLTSDIPSQGTMSARGAARVFAGLLGHTGVSLVSPARLTELARPAFEGPDEVMGMRSSWAFGFSPQRPSGVPSRPGSTFGMLGANGSGAWADIDSGVAVAVLRNRFSPDWTVVGKIDRLVAELFPTEP